jgi:hypothetical protein
MTRKIFISALGLASISGQNRGAELSRNATLAPFHKGLESLGVEDFNRFVSRRSADRAAEFISTASGNTVSVRIFEAKGYLGISASALIHNRGVIHRKFSSEASGFLETGHKEIAMAFQSIFSWTPRQGVNPSSAGQDHARLLIRRKNLKMAENLILLNSPDWKSEVENIEEILKNINFCIAIFCGNYFRFPEKF